MRLGAALLTIVLGAAACGGQAPAAATVNGERISASAVDRELADIAENKELVEARAREGAPLFGTRPGTYDAFAVAALLSRKVTALLVRQELRRRGIAAASADLADARQTLRRQVVDPGTGASLLEGFPEGYVVEQARIQAESDLLQASEGGVALDEAALRAAYGAGRLRREGDVTVSDRFGTWDRSDPDAIAIVPAGGRPTTTAAASTTTSSPVDP